MSEQPERIWTQAQPAPSKAFCSYSDKPEPINGFTEYVRVDLTLPQGPVGWRDISTAPKDGTRFLAFEQSGDYCISECWWQHDFQEWSGWQNDWDNEPNPTHWMPLPAAPGQPEQPSVAEAAREAVKVLDGYWTGSYWTGVSHTDEAAIKQAFATLRSLTQGAG